ncbi:histidinol phosphate phosphatase H [Gloeophyllum trabeum ATCC 11539]|uniref:Histidinol-phosphatase n=1 Tax=Gloeophyllum trabeum (strain ATCC 11539 / FP-39264 / Madison 617) TaxID=670483 RepID=S7PSD6_GLOTA|nr:histidinol phosphate phosphatase H [Gloeophyllum trabeum ATCC 11539]EPQ50302.1 histidinol phosphate phosphatase H [Gloeophyllum trabeum ATCC 11539]
MPHSHHSHSGQFCKHAKGTLEEVVIEAIKQGFHTYGLTEHVPRYREADLYPEEAGCSLDSLAWQFEGFLDEAHRLKSAYAAQIRLLVGLETEFITDMDLEYLEKLLEKHKGRVDYLVGSIHHVNGIPIDFDEATYRQSIRSLSTNDSVVENSDPESMERFLCMYLDAQYRVMRRFHPEVIGHFDLFRLYTPDVLLLRHSKAWEKVERNIQYATGYGAVFEVNAAALRKGWKSPYPAPDVLQAILQLGGRLVLSDDSHGPQAVGLNYDLVKEYLTNMGVTQLHYLQISEEPNNFGRHVVAVKVENHWWEDPFWNTHHPVQR